LLLDGIRSKELALSNSNLIVKRIIPAGYNNKFARMLKTFAAALAPIVVLAADKGDGTGVD
jgi:hypothetical protein